MSICELSIARKRPVSADATLSRSVGRSVLAIGLISAIPAWGQQRVDWYNISGGAGSSIGWSYVLAASMGPGETGPLLSASFGLREGFWAILLEGADVRMAIRDDPDPLLPPSTLTYRLTVSNEGPEIAEGVLVSLATPSGLTFLSNSGDCTSAFPCSFAALAPGEVRDIEARFTVPPGYAGPNPIANTGSVVAATFDPTPTNNTVLVKTAVGTASADVVLAKIGPSSAMRGGTITYVINVRNGGPSAADSVLVTDPTPPGLGFISNSGACGGPFPCSLGTIPEGENRSIASTFSIPPAYGGSDPVRNTATAEAGTADPLVGNNEATASAALLEGTASLRFHTVIPCRLIDTRRTGGPLGGPALVAGSLRTFDLANVCDIPLTAQAISINVAVTQPSVAGHLRIYPAQSLLPVVASINYAAGQTRTNNGIVALGPAASLSVSCDQSSGTAHFILDVNGYFE
jgi:uncharacterized repeat protein (TIGR01451 family)